MRDWKEGIIDFQEIFTIKSRGFRHFHILYVNKESPAPYSRRVTPYIFTRVEKDNFQNIGKSTPKHVKAKRKKTGRV